MRVLVILWLLGSCVKGVAQGKGWKLHAEKDGVQVFTQPVNNSAFKAVKAVGVVEASMSRIAYVLMDVKTTKEWVYGTKVCTLLKQMTPSDLIYYSEVDLPWPVSNRDFIIRITLSQDPKTRVMTIVAENMPTYISEKNGIIRIQRSSGLWHITPVDATHVRVEYTLQVDPGGWIPAWLVNMVASTGPYQSFIGLRKQVKKEKYGDARLEGITD
jgi:hypothetical protein